jgi:RNA polymerase sigma factor (sigma-70 family)
MSVPSAEATTPDLGWPGANLGRDRASPVRGTDEQLARAAGRGDVAAFEALYERHHRALLSFARHTVGSPHDAEDVVQHTFVAADRTFRSGKVPKAVRAWLYTVARNRCVSMLRERRAAPGVADAELPSTENLAAAVEQRDELRGLLADLRELPDDQRTALLLAELGDLTHAEVAKVIGVRSGKVKALVFQARETLMGFAHARAIPCRSIREELSVATGAELRRRHLRQHVARCPACAEFAAGVREQRAALMIVLPVVPTAALRETVFGALAGGAASAGAAAGTGAGAGLGLVAAKSTAAKLLAIAAVGGTAATGGTVAVTAVDGPERPPASERRAEPARSPARPATEPARGPDGSATKPASPAVASPRAAPTARGDRARGRSRADAPVGPATRPEQSAPGQMKKLERGAGTFERAVPPGQAKKLERVAPGQAKKAERAAPSARSDKAMARGTKPAKTMRRETKPAKAPAARSLRRAKTRTAPAKSDATPAKPHTAQAKPRAARPHAPAKPHPTKVRAAPEAAPPAPAPAETEPRGKSTQSSR